MSEKMIEYNDHTELVDSNRSGTIWKTYEWRLSKIDTLRGFLQEVYLEGEEQFKPGEVSILVKSKDKDPIISYYFNAAGLNRIANVKHICTKVDLIDKVRKHIGNYEDKWGNTKPKFYYEANVKATAVLKNGTFHEQLGYCDSSEPGKEKMVFSNILGMAETRARNRALRIAIEALDCSTEELPPHMQEQLLPLEKEILQNCPDCGKKGWSRLQKRCMQCNITYEEILQKKEPREA